MARRSQKRKTVVALLSFVAGFALCSLSLTARTMPPLRVPLFAVGMAVMTAGCIAAYYMR